MTSLGTSPPSLNRSGNSIWYRRNALFILRRNFRDGKRIGKTALAWTEVHATRPSRNPADCEVIQIDDPEPRHDPGNDAVGDNQHEHDQIIGECGRKQEGS